MIDTDILEKCMSVSKEKVEAAEKAALKIKEAEDFIKANPCPYFPEIKLNKKGHYMRYMPKQGVFAVFSASGKQVNHASKSSIENRILIGNQIEDVLKKHYGITDKDS